MCSCARVVDHGGVREHSVGGGRLPARDGYIEVCKAANPALIDGFRFNIVDANGTQTVTIAIGTCTQPIPVVSGIVTVTELGALTGLTNTGAISTTPTTEFLSATSTAVGPTGPLGTTNGFVRVVNVPASPNGSSGVVTVTYNNTLVTGWVEVCKQIVAGSGLTGSWSFTIVGGNGFATTVSVPAGNCSQPIQVPAGKVVVREVGDASEAVTAITATRTAALINVVLGPLAGPAPDLDTATVVAAVVAGDVSTQTLVTFTNNSVRLKLCKYVDQGLTNLGPYTFTFPTVTGNPGPVGPIATESITAGIGAANAVCKVIGTFRAGTTVTIVEGIVAGTKVGSITVNPAINAYNGGPTIVPGSLSLANRTVTVVLGKGETVVTYQDVPALPGILKICKLAGVSTPAGTTWNGVHVRRLSAKRCHRGIRCPGRELHGHRDVPVQHDVVDRRAGSTEHEGAVDHGGPDLRGRGRSQLEPAGTHEHRTWLTRSTNVTIGENNTTEVTYVNIDPIDPPPVVEPPVVTPPVVSPPSGGSGGSSGGSSSGGSSGGSSASSSSSSASTPTLPTTPAVISTTTGVGIGIGTSSSASKTSVATKAAVLKAAKLAKLKKQMTTLNVKLKGLVAKHAAAKTLAAKHSLAKQIAVLKVSKVKLAKQITLLKSSK